MKIRIYIPIILAALAFCSCAEEQTAVEFGVDTNEFKIGAEGGKRSLNIASENNWVATASDPWITVSPANGRGSIDCQISIDSAKTENSRRGIVQIKNIDTRENREITIDQKGYEYALTVDNAQVAIQNFAAFGKRYFEVKVNTNVDFDVVIPTAVENWVKSTKSTVTHFDRGVIRPRQITVRFDWGINSQPNERLAEISFRPKKEVVLAKHDNLTIIQGAAEAIPEHTRKGDSIAVLAVARTLGMDPTWENSGEAMNNWVDIQLWRKGMPEYTPAKEGRVRYVRFFIFNSKEGLPFEIQYLTAAEEIVVYGNSNTFLLSLDTGEYITKLTQLKRLTIGGYGLTTLHKDFTKLKNLTSIDLGSNNFQKVPEEINPVNFPRLRRLYMGANQRNSIYDLSNTILTNYGGLSDDKGLSERLLQWNGLDTLSLSVNFLQGSIPSMENWDKYTEEDINNSRDTLPRAMIGTPKVLPTMKRLSINLNRFTGDIPWWLLHHPMLNYWGADIMVFTQEGKDATGKSAGFNNTPANLNYYFDFYTKKKRPSDAVVE